MIELIVDNFSQTKILTRRGQLHKEWLDHYTFPKDADEEMAFVNFLVERILRMEEND